MARLTNPATGTVVSIEGDLEARYRAAGWTDAESDQQETATPEKPRRRSKPKE